MLVFICVNVYFFYKKLIPSSKKHFPFKRLKTMNLDRFIYIKPKPYNLILDLDGTLVNVTKAKTKKTQIPFYLDVIHKQKYSYFAEPRPHLQDFIKEMRKHFNLYLFTRGTREYAEILADNLGLTSQIRDIYCRDDLVKSENDLCKDLKAIGFDMKRSVLLDDSPQYVAQKENLIQVKKFSGESDEELARVQSLLLEFIEQSRTQNDIGVFIQQKNK